jgi:iron complex outermembrane recepter protein
VYLRASAGQVRLGQLKLALLRPVFRRGLAMAGALLLCSVRLHAQTPPRDTALIRLDTLQVPVTRSTMDPERAPLALSLVGRSMIQDGRPSVSLDEALAGVPGLVVSNRQNYSLGPRIVMRGMGARAAFGVRGVRVVVDGIPLTMPDGQTNLTNLDLGSAGSIHVLRGPASALFGNAAGGVIAVETEPAPGALAAEARVVAGDQGRGDIGRLWKAQAKVGQTVGAVDYVASVARMETDGYRDHSRSEQTLFNSRAGITLSDATRLGFVLSVADMPLAQNPGSLPWDSARAEPTMAWPANARLGAGEKTRQAQLGARLVRARGAARTDVSVYGVRRSLLNPLPFGVIDLGRDAGGLRAQHEQPLRLRWTPIVTMGADVELQRDDRREFANVAGQPSGPPRRDQEDRVSTIGPFVQLRGDAGALSLTAGARYDAVRFEVRDRRGIEPDRSGGRTLDAVSSMVGASYSMGGATIFANIASAFQTPTTTELINSPPAPGEPCCPAGFNPRLEPQRARSAELGARGAHGLLAYGVAVYHMAVRDALVPFQVPNAEGRDFFRNAARTRHRGTEIDASLRPHPAVGLNGAYTFTDVRFQAAAGAEHFSGNRLPGIPPHRLHVALTVQAAGVAFTAETERTAAQFADDANTVRVPAATRLDLRAQTAMRLSGSEIAPFVAINNVLNARYFGSVSVNAAASRYFEPAPGRHVYLGTTLRTGAWRR